MPMAEAAEHADELTTARIPAKFHPSKKYTFPVRMFGSKREKRSFRADWCEKYDWLRYDRVADAAFCHLCVTAEREKKFLAMCSVCMFVRMCMRVCVCLYILCMSFVCTRFVSV